MSAAVGRRDAHPPWAGAPDHRTDLVVLSLVDGAPRGRRAVLSPWGGTAPNPAPAACWAVCRRPPCRPLVWTRWPARAPSGVRPETAVPSYPRGAARLLTRHPPPVGRCAQTAVSSARVDEMARPRALRSASRDRRAVPPRVDDPADPRALRGAPRDRRAVLSPWGGTAPTRCAARSGEAAPRPPCRLAPRHGARPAASPRVERPLDRRVVLTPVGGAAPGSPRPRRWAAWLGPPCRPRRGEEGDTA